MLQSLFTTYVAAQFSALVASIVALINGGKTPLTYLHKTMLTKEFSVSGKFSSVNTDNTTVAADVVSMDSSLPLKKRDSLGTYDGDIPKLGTARSLNEQTMSDLLTLIAKGGQAAEVAKKIFQDIPKVIGGIYERCEFMFLEALSTGVTATADATNVGALIRFDFGYKAANKFGAASVVWTNGAATPLADIKRVLDKANADGVVINKILMDNYAFDNFVKGTDVKNLYAMNLNFSGTNILSPDLAQVNKALEQKFGVMIQIINRNIKTEKNGVVTNTKPWAEGNVIFISNDKVGRLVWAELAEMTFRAEQVAYEVADSYILVSKYHENNPIREFTTSQARVVPVLDNVNEIYLLESKSVQV